MKRLLLAIVCLPALALGQTYTYNKLIATKQGNDNLSFDRGYCLNVSGGHIVLAHDVLYIDQTQYILKPKKRANCYKSRKCSFEFMYQNRQLAAVKQFRYDEVILYIIDNEAVLTTR